MAALLSTSKVRNPQHDITGVLVRSRHWFAQVLEGRSAAVDALMARVRGDHRHAQVRVLSREDIATRRFDRWSMELVERDDLEEWVAGLHAARPSPPTSWS